MESVRTPCSTFKAERAAYLKLCEGVNSPRSLACWILASNNEWAQVLKLPVCHDDTKIRQSADDYLVTSVMKKNPRLPLQVDATQVALDKFLECEEHVRLTNIRLKMLPAGLRSASIDPEIRKVLRSARRIISKILGPLSSRDLESVWNSARFGPGSTSAVSGTDVSASRKYSTLGATPRLAPLLKTLLPSLWYEGAYTSIIPVVWHSRVTTVPKTALTERPICVEPHLNGWIQLGIARVLRKKLKRAGLDLDTGADFNRLLASYAQEWGLATIDLESASDTIAETLVRLLLPVRWVHLLELGRTDYTEMPDGTILRLEKWSSMGNGYTFELESLIFYSLALACTRLPAHTACFGDDLIVPQSDADSLITILEFCGFRVNRSKTFLAGAFFESCGTDWLCGIDIRPFYFKSEVTCHEDSIDAKFKMANQIRRYAFNSAKRDARHGCDKRFLPAWLSVRSSVPKGWLNCRVPDGIGDDQGFVSNFDEASPSFNKRFGDYRYTRRSRKAASGPVKSLHGHLLSHLASSPRQFVSKFLRGRANQWSIGDYLEIEPDVSIRLSEDGQLRVSALERATDLRGVKLKGQLAVGYVQTWPSLGPWL